MKPRNWRKRYGCPLTTDRELHTLPDCEIARQEKAYREWLVSSGRVVADDYYIALVENERRDILRWRQEEVERAKTAISIAPNSYRRKEARKALREAEARFASTETEMAISKAYKALEWAVNDYIHAQYREPHVIISQFGDRSEDNHVDEFKTRMAFRQFYKSVERFA